MAAFRDAGYSDGTARSQAYEIVRRPSIQSELTEALRASGLTADRMAMIIKDAAEAKMVVFNPDTGGGSMVDVPAHAIRLKAYDRWARAHGFETPLTPKNGVNGTQPPLNQPNFDNLTTEELEQLKALYEKLFQIPKLLNAEPV